MIKQQVWSGLGVREDQLICTVIQSPAHPAADEDTAGDPTRQKMTTRQVMPTRQKMPTRQVMPTRQKMTTRQVMPTRQKMTTRQVMPTRQNVRTWQGVPTQQDRGLQQGRLQQGLRLQINKDMIQWWLLRMVVWFFHYCLDRLIRLVFWTCQWWRWCRGAWTLWCKSQTGRTDLQSREGSSTGPPHRPELEIPRPRP